MSVMERTEIEDSIVEFCDDGSLRIFDANTGIMDIGIDDKDTINLASFLSQCIARRRRRLILEKEDGQ